MSRRVYLTEARVAELAERLSPTEQAIIETLDRVRLASSVQLQSLHFAGCGTPLTVARRARRTFERLVSLRILAVTELYVRLRQAETFDRFELVAFDAEPQCWRRFTGLGGARLTLKPDAFVWLAVGGREHFSFVEVDRATHSATALGRKLAVYRRYLASGREQARFGLFPRVVVLVPDESRKQVAVDVCAAQPADSWPLWQIALAGDALPSLTGTRP